MLSALLRKSGLMCCAGKPARDKQLESGEQSLDVDIPEENEEETSGLKDEYAATAGRAQDEQRLEILRDRAHGVLAATQHAGLLEKAVAQTVREEPPIWDEVEAPAEPVSPSQKERRQKATFLAPSYVDGLFARAQARASAQLRGSAAVSLGSATAGAREAVASRGAFAPATAADGKAAGARLRAWQTLAHAQHAGLLQKAFMLLLREAEEAAPSVRLLSASMVMPTPEPAPLPKVAEAAPAAQQPLGPAERVAPEEENGPRAVLQGRAQDNLARAYHAGLVDSAIEELRQESAIGAPRREMKNGAGAQTVSGILDKAMAILEEGSFKDSASPLRNGSSPLRNGSSPLRNGRPA